MIKWSVLQGRISRALGDTSVTPADLTDYINQALAAISAHTALQKMYVQVLTADTSLITLPDDLLELGPVHVKVGSVENNIYKPVRLEAGRSLPVFPVPNWQAGEYYRWGETINFLNPLLSGKTVELLYWAYWPTVEQDEDTIPVLRWMEEPLLWYCLHLAMAKPAAGAGRLRTWNTKQDSGQPEQNSPQKFAEFCVKRYHAILNDMASQDRTGWEGRQ